MASASFSLFTAPVKSMAWIAADLTNPGAGWSPWLPYAPAQGSVYEFAFTGTDLYLTARGTSLYQYDATIYTPSTGVSETHQITSSSGSFDAQHVNASALADGVIHVCTITCRYAYVPYFATASTPVIRVDGAAPAISASPIWGETYKLAEIGPMPAIRFEPPRAVLVDVAGTQTAQPINQLAPTGIPLPGTAATAITALMHFQPISATGPYTTPFYRLHSMRFRATASQIRVLTGWIPAHDSYGGSRWCLVTDGNLATAQYVVDPGGSGVVNWGLVSFTTDGTAEHEYEFGCDAWINGNSVAASMAGLLLNGSINKNALAEKPIIVFAGDSLCGWASVTGTGADAGGMGDGTYHHWSKALGNAMGCAIHSINVGGSGATYTSAVTAGNIGYQFGDWQQTLIPLFTTGLPKAPAMIIFSLGYNDSVLVGSTVTAASYQAAIAAIIATVRAYWGPAVKLVFQDILGTSPNITTLRASLIAAVAAAADPNTVTLAGAAGSPVYYGQAPYTADGTHPNQAGDALIAAWTIPLIKSLAPLTAAQVASGGGGPFVGGGANEF